jgi:hypothetical protein
MSLICRPSRVCRGVHWETVVQTGTGSVPTTAVGWEYYSTTT